MASLTRARTHHQRNRVDCGSNNSQSMCKARLSSASLMTCEMIVGGQYGGKLRHNRPVNKYTQSRKVSG